MKSKIAIAFVLLAIGLVDVVDWIIFSTRPAYRNLDWDAFKIKYVQHLPTWLQRLKKNPLISTITLFLFFLAAGLIFMNARKQGTAYLILAIFSFILAFWMLFSLM